MEDSKQQQPKKNYRKRSSPIEEEEEKDGEQLKRDESDDERVCSSLRMALEEIKVLQKQRERKSGIPANPSLQTQRGNGGGLFAKATKKNVGDDGDKDELILQDTFAQETAVMVEDPTPRLPMLRDHQWASFAETRVLAISPFTVTIHRSTPPSVAAVHRRCSSLSFIVTVQELVKKRGRKIDTTDQVENELKRAEDELYKIPEHLKVKRRNSEESSTQWTTGIAELRNIEETEGTKKLLQEKRLMGRAKSEFSIPSSYSADYFPRVVDYAEKLRGEHPEDEGAGSKQSDAIVDASGKGQAATDEFIV